MTIRNVLVAILVTASAGSGAALSAPSIPLREGLMIVDSYRSGNGDFETIITVTQTTAKDVTLTASTDESADTCRAGADPRRRSWGVRTVNRDDLENAGAFRQEWSACPASPQVNPGMTAISVSRRVLQELRLHGETSFTADTSKNGMVAGTLTRLEPDTVPVSVVVNDRPEALSAMHVRWRSSVGEREYWILDDPADALILRAVSMGRPFLEVVKIAFPTEEPAAARLQRDLQSNGRTALYGLLFNFGSDHLRDESASLLSDIARVLEQHRTWSLLIEGHTDNIGTAAYNQELSTRRAAAVKELLVTRFHIDASRLRIAGFGAARSKDTNDTLEGRAKNRRVELVRE